MRDIRNYEGLYAVTEDGRIWSHSRSYKSPNGGSLKTGGKYLAMCKTGSGYPFVILCKNGVRKQVMVHRIVANTFIPNPKKLPEVNHIDGNKTNGQTSNLEWCTSKQNKAHSWKLGTSKHRGQYQWHAKLTPEIVTSIRQLVRTGTMQKSLAKQYKISTSAVSKIVNRTAWAHIGNENEPLRVSHQLHPL